ncbi:MAG: LysM peptidoglycan-binding domain-containing protein [Spirochaetales bacterium]|nr:LysM peptidoglycan-binding domain-containing protein [Spirochaetales bacterium]
MEPKFREWKDVMLGLLESAKLWLKIFSKQFRKLIKKHVLSRMIPYKKYIIVSSVAVLFASVVAFSVMSNYFPYDIKSLLVIASEQNIYENIPQIPFIENGIGQLAINRVEDIDYFVKEKDTLHGISYVFNVRAAELRVYNNLGPSDTLVPGQMIKIPSMVNIRRFMNSARRQAVGHLVSTEGASAAVSDALPKELNISVQTQSRGKGITAFFSIDTKILGKNFNYQWDLGDGQKIMQKVCVYTYSVPGLYKVMLTVRDSEGTRVESNQLYVYVPHYGYEYKSDRLFLTVNNVGDIFPLDGEITEAKDMTGKIKRPVRFIEKSDGVYYYQTEASGYFQLKYKEKYRTILVSLFVSPLDSIHSDRVDIDWYQTQYGTGLSNCGPTTVSIGIAWARGRYIPVPEVRDFIGWYGNGSTSLKDLQLAMAENGVKSSYTNIFSAEDLFAIIDRQNIAVVGYHCGKISHTAGDPQTDLFGAYYSDSTGHYAILKGYTRDKKYIIMYDPLPSDWGVNGVRYGDGLSMIGRNRYYPVSEFMYANNSSVALEITR